MLIKSSALLKRYLACLLSTAVLWTLGGCDSDVLPSYWLCSGFATQQLLGRDGLVMESYIDRHQLVLDVWGTSIYQFYQPTLSSRYTLCEATQKSGLQDGLMHFSYPSCHPENNSLDDLLYAYGILNRSSGLLEIHESKNRGDRLIRNEGRYQCQYLGHRFSFNEINYAKP
jgi:hypothetical protein